MSIKVTAMLWQVEFSEVSAKLVALKLADCASDLGDSIFPSVNTITRHTGSRSRPCASGCSQWSIVDYSMS